MESSWTVAVTREIPDAGLQPLREATKVKLWDQELPPSAEELDELLQGCDGAITLLTDHIDGSVLDRHPSLRVISNFAVGFDNIDVPAATERGVLVCNTPDVLTNATADHTWALLLAAARRIPESIAYVRAGKWKTWGPLLLLGRGLAERRSVSSVWDESARRSQNVPGDSICASWRSIHSKTAFSRANMR
jgi:glyoxylate reductase